VLGAESAGNFIRWATYRKCYITGRFARFGIDKRLEELLPYKNGFYVELGAHDGALASNTYYFELNKGWKGVLIEPSPNLFLSCNSRRGLNNFVFCNACVPFNYKENFVEMKYLSSMTISNGLDLDIDDKFVERGDKNLIDGECTFVFGAKSATLTSLLDKSNAPSLIDFISLDVEGAELDVLKGLDFGAYNFKYMVIECRNIERLSSYLANYGYSIEEKITHHDYLFKYTHNV
jgi:FkbM family methyltransferase